ncbi:hypothetical protein BDZ91DRAFT_730629, partial [Kalaharituber pfeilii]
MKGHLFLFLVSFPHSLSPSHPLSPFLSLTLALFCVGYFDRGKWCDMWMESKRKIYSVQLLFACALSKQNDINYQFTV